MITKKRENTKGKAPKSSWGGVGHERKLMSMAMDNKLGSGAS